MEFDKKKELLGKLLFILSFLLLGYMIISPFAKTIIHVDEFWTIGVINLSLSETIPLMISDVHPPLYYLVLKVIFKALSIFGIHYTNIFVLKLFSILPYGLILIVFCTKIRKEYNWLTVGLFTFVLGSLSMFFIQFLTIRMYNWGLLFLLMSFIYFKGIISNSDKKSWILFTIFSVLVAYTHYFILISTFLLYLILLIHIYRNNDSKLKIMDQLKKWCLSVISAIVLYLPWLFIFLSQVNHRQHVLESSFPTAIEIVNYFTYFTGIESVLSFETLLFKLFAFIILLLFVYIFIKEFNNESNVDRFYVGTGLILLFLSILLGIIIVSLAFNIFSIRYLVPVASIFWFSVCIIIGKINNNRLFIISTLIILFICALGFTQTIESTHLLCDESTNALNMMDSLNNNDTVIVYTQEFHYINFHNYLNETKEYKSEFSMPYSPKNIKTIKNISKLYEKYPDKNIYIIKAIDFKTNDDFDNVIVNNSTYEKYGNYYNIWFIHAKGH